VGREFQRDELADDIEQREWQWDTQLQLHGKYGCSEDRHDYGPGAYAHGDPGDGFLHLQHLLDGERRDGGGIRVMRRHCNQRLRLDRELQRDKLADDIKYWKRERNGFF